jgi:hypothetical protein
MTHAEIEKLEDLFLKCEMKKEFWTHEAHFVVATCILFENPSINILPLLRDLIRRNNIFMGIQNTEDAGYHETITWLYIGEIQKVLAGKIHITKAEAVQEVLKSAIVAKDYPLRFYSKELLFSKKARATVVHPIPSV